MSPQPSWSFLLDQHVAKSVGKALRAKGYSALRVYDDPIVRNQDDPVIFRYACARHMIIITQDKDFLKQNEYPPPHPGIFVLRGFLAGSPIVLMVQAVLNALDSLAGMDLSDKVYIIEPASVYLYS